MLDKTSVFVCVALGATLSTARADTEPEADPGTVPHAASTPSEEGNDQLTLPKGRAVLDAYVGISLSDGAAFKPVSVSPDVWYGVTDDITVGLVHSGLGTTGFIGSAGESLCLTGSDNGCGDVYHNFGFDARYKLSKTAGPLSYAVGGGLYALNIDPFALALKLGGVARWHKDKLAIEAQGNLFIGVTERTTGEGMAEVTTNGETLYLPITGFYTVAPKIAVSAQLGLVLPFENTGDAFAVPLSIGGHYTLNESLNLTLAFSFPRIIAGTDGGIDARSLTLGGTYAF